MTCCLDKWLGCSIASSRSNMSGDVSIVIRCLDLHSVMQERPN